MKPIDREPPSRAAHLVLLRQLEPRLRHVARRVRAQVQVGDVDDLVQVGLLEAWKLAPAFDPSRGIAFATYVRKRVHFAMLEHCARERREAVRVEVATSSLLAMLGSDEDVDAREEALAAAFEELRAADPLGGALLEGTAVEDRPLTEVARALAVSYKKARLALARAKAMLVRLVQRRSSVSATVGSW